MAERPNVGFIGLGAMGLPMAKRVLLHGSYPLTVLDVVPGRVEEMVGLGARPAGSPRAVAQGSEVVITMLPSSPDVEKVVLGEAGVLEGLKPGSVLIEMSTIDPAVTKAVAARVGAKGGRMLDAPVGRNSFSAAEGTLSIMVGGDAATLEECRPILATMGSSIVHCGPAGAGEAMKLTHNLMGCLIDTAIAEGLALGAKAGLSPEAMLSVIGNGGASSF
ncbi:MAG TPA: NAD(P)-binding domain-containing protein, partial [Chloroflexota bacterium]